VTPLPTLLPSIDRPTGRPDALPPPPASFDPIGLPFVYDLAADGRVGLWVGPIGDPARARPVVPPLDEGQGAYQDPWILGDGRLVAIRTLAQSGFNAELVLIDPVGEITPLLDQVGPHPAVSADGSAVLVSRIDAGTRDKGVWRVELEGRTAEQVLANRPPDAVVERAALAITADGRSVAAAACVGRLQAKFGNEAPVELPAGIPLGFDARGRLLAQVDCAHNEIVRFTPGSDEPEAMIPPAGGYFALVTSNGRTLAVRNSVELPGQLLIVDLESGDRNTTALASGVWEFVPQSNSRYVVLVQSTGGPLGSWLAIHDLTGRWTGYIQITELPPG
jgi:hypothetical protein